MADSGVDYAKKGRVTGVVASTETVSDWKRRFLVNIGIGEGGEDTVVGLTPCPPDTHSTIREKMVHEGGISRLQAEMEEKQEPVEIDHERCGAFGAADGPFRIFVRGGEKEIG